MNLDVEQLRSQYRFLSSLIRPMVWRALHMGINRCYDDDDDEEDDGFAASTWDNRLSTHAASAANPSY
jgi:hypothetical protein